MTSGDLTGPSLRLRWTLAMKRKVAQARAEGRTCEDIAREFGVSVSAISNIVSRLNRVGGEIQEPARVVIDWTAERDSALRDLVTAGVARRIAALDLGSAARRCRLGGAQVAIVRRIAERKEKQPRLPRVGLPSRGLDREFPHRVSIIDHVFGQCVFPTWAHHEMSRADEAFYCGAPTGGQTWCADCRAVVYVPRLAGRVA